MELIIISPSKLKISLSKSDLESFDISVDMLDYGNTETKRLLWDILNHAKHSVGWNSDGHRVFVQLFPSKDGSCEMFVTKVGNICSSIYDSSEKAAANNEDMLDAEKEGLCGEDKSCFLYDDSPEHTCDITVRVFEMLSLPALLDACRRLSQKGFDEKSSLYIFNSKFYLFIFCNDVSHYLPLDDLSFLGEYGSRKFSNDLMLDIYEFGKIICEENAVKILSDI